MSTTLKLIQKKSSIGRIKRQKATLIGLKLNKIGAVSVLEDSPSVRGMIRSVAHLIEVIEG